MAFDFPPLHAFPPFFTRQVNQETLQSQMQQWQGLILAYAKHEALYRLPISQESLQLPLFSNVSIKRSMKLDMLRDVIDRMVKDGTAEYVSKKRDTALLFWRSADEWATLLHDNLDSTGQLGSVMTMYELTEGSVGSQFQGMDPVFLRRIVDALVKKGKATVMKDSVGDEQGVKFF